MDNKFDKVCVVKKKKSFIALGVFGSFLALTIIFSIVLSPLLGLNYLGGLFSKNANGTVCANYYAVVIDSKTDNESTATEMAQKIRIRGGAGVLIQQKTYLIAVSAYQSKTDAEKVANQIATDEMSPELLKIEIKSKTSKLSESEKEEYNRCFDFILLVIDSLYELSSKLDKGEITEINANLQIKNLLLDASYLNQELFSKRNNHFKNLKTIVSSTTNLLEYIANEDVLASTLLPYSSDIRRTYMRILFLIYEMN